MDLIGRRILIVEDDDDIREVLRDFFVSEGCSVATAFNGLEGLRRLETAPLPDIIFLDLMMPIMSGEEFATQVQKNAKWSSIPIVIMSADHQTQQIAELLKIKWYVRKPVALTTLVSMAEEALDA